MRNASRDPDHRGDDDEDDEDEDEDDEDEGEDDEDEGEGNDEDDGHLTSLDKGRSLHLQDL